jgi:hypothetical protein
MGFDRPSFDKVGFDKDFGKLNPSQPAVGDRWSSLSRPCCDGKLSFDRPGFDKDFGKLNPSQPAAGGPDLSETICSRNS